MEYTKPCTCNNTGRCLRCHVDAQREAVASKPAPKLVRLRQRCGDPFIGERPAKLSREEYVKEFEIYS